MTAAAPRHGNGALRQFLKRAVDIRDNEVPAFFASFTYFFFVMGSWFVLRPIRDAVAAATGVSKIPWLYTGTLTLMLIANPLFSALVARYKVKKFIAITYHFFIANLLLFYVFMRFVAPVEGSAGDVALGRAFFVWTSVFNLFVISVFWSFMADVFSSEEAKRLFGSIGVGGTLGSIAGSSFTAAFAQQVGTKNLLLISAVLLEIAVIAVLRFPRFQSSGARGAPPAEDRKPIGGRIWAGVTQLMKSKYLSATALFLVLYLIGSTVLYFQQSDIVGREYADRDARTRVLAQLEVAAQSLTVIVQLLLTGRMIRWIGLGSTLAVVPAVGVIGFGVLGTAPSFATFAVVQVIRRASNFAIMNPAMEVLYTVVPREDKYKAKGFIETFVYRSADQIAAWTYAGLVAAGLALSGIAIAAVPMAAISLWLGVWLGRRQNEMAVTQQTQQQAAQA